MPFPFITETKQGPLQMQQFDAMTVTTDNSMLCFICFCSKAVLAQPVKTVWLLIITSAFLAQDYSFFFHFYETVTVPILS